MNRDEEIEAFAIASTASWIERITPIEGLPSSDAIDGHFEDSIASAAIAWDARDRYRAARQPAPETQTPTPTPRIEVLKRWLECCVKLRISSRVRLNGNKNEGEYLFGTFLSAMPDVSLEEIQALRQHAATLKERKEKADEK